MNCTAEDDLDQDLHGGRAAGGCRAERAAEERAVEYSAEARG